MDTGFVCIVYPGVLGLESDPTPHREHEHKQAACVLEVLLGAWHAACAIHAGQVAASRHVERKFYEIGSRRRDDGLADVCGEGRTGMDMRGLSTDGSD